MDNTHRYIYRIVHIRNLGHFLAEGLYSKNSGHVIPDYVNIGDPELIKDRNTYRVKVDPPGGCLGDYIPFYFAGHSPMLYKIKTGYGVKQYPQVDLIYIVCRIDDIILNCSEWCFTDGHAKNSLTKFYNSTDELTRVDWKAVQAQYWSSTEDDMDIKRRKQSEFLVKNHIPVSCIKKIIVLNEESKKKTEEIVRQCGVVIPIEVDTSFKFFYR